jgi:hypothetical protein
MTEQSKAPAVLLSTKFCEEHGHFFHSSGVVFARDAQGVAFRGGPDWHGARKYMVYLCNRCLMPVEVKITPHLEQRKGQPFEGSGLDKGQKLRDQKIKIHA